MRIKPSTWIAIAAIVIALLIAARQVNDEMPSYSSGDDAWVERPGASQEQSAAEYYEYLKEQSDSWERAQEARAQAEQNKLNNYTQRKMNEEQPWMLNPND